MKSAADKKAYRRKREWLIAGGLILLSIVPMAGGAARVSQLASGAQITSENARFFAMPLPVLVHIFSASLFLVLGAFQLAPGLRPRRGHYHRIAGRLLVPLGLAAALAGLWMTLFYPHPAMDDGLLVILRLVFGSAMVVAIVLGFRAILQRDILQHSNWMMRGYAIGMGAGTQVLTNVPYILLVHKPAVGLSRSVLLGAGWVINLGVAEWIIRNRRTKPTRTIRVQPTRSTSNSPVRRRSERKSSAAAGTPSSG